MPIMIRAALWAAFLCFAAWPPVLLARTCPRDFYQETLWEPAMHSLSVARSDLVAVKSAPNRVLYFGGRTSLSASSPAVDSLDTETNVTTPFAPGMWEARHLAAGARAGSVVLIGGGYAGGFNASSTVDIFYLDAAGNLANRSTCYYNVTTEVVNQVNTTDGNSTNVTNVTTQVTTQVANNCGHALSVARSKLAAVAVGSDWILFAGGQSGAPGATTDHNAVDIYNVKTGVWSVSATALVNPRYYLTATAIDNATVLFCGGGDQAGAHRACEVYELRTNTSTGTSTWLRTSWESPLTNENLGLFVGRFAPAAVLLAGRVLIAGGQESGGGGWSRRVDFFDVSRSASDVFRWQTTALALSTGHENIAGAVLGGRAFFAGRDFVDVYDGTARVWASAPSFGATLVSAWAAVGVGDTRIFFAGWDFADRRVLVYDLEGCMACPFGATAEAGSTLATNCSCLPGYAGADGTACVCCDVAQHKAGVGDFPCIPCPTNSLGSLQSAPLPRCTSDPNACCDPSAGERLLGFNPRSAAVTGVCGNPFTTTPAPILSAGAALRARVGLSRGAALLTGAVVAVWCGR